MSSSLLLRQVAEESAPAAAPARAAFGDAGSWYFTVLSGVAFSDDATDIAGTLGAGVFLADKFEINFGASGWNFNQDGDNAGGGNPHFGFRYHFMPKDPFNVYLDTGIGLLFSGDDVPDTGTSVNFTPRAGVGTLWMLGDQGLRLDVGVRWHHISNASTDGSDDNPSRDSFMVYAGLVFPF